MLGMSWYILIYLVQWPLFEARLTAKQVEFARESPRGLSNYTLWLLSSIPALVAKVVPHCYDAINGYSRRLFLVSRSTILSNLYGISISIIAKSAAKYCYVVPNNKNMSYEIRLNGIFQTVSVIRNVMAIITAIYLQFFVLIVWSAVLLQLIGYLSVFLCL